MDFHLTEAQQALRDEVASFAKDVVAPGAAARDRDKSFPSDLIAEAGGGATSASSSPRPTAGSRSATSAKAWFSKRSRRPAPAPT